MKLSDIMASVDLIGCSIVKDAEVSSTEFCSRIRVDHALTFLGNEKLISCLDIDRPISVICNESLVDKLPSSVKGVIVAPDPKYAFYCIHNYIAEKSKKNVPTVVGENCVFEEGCHISKHNVVIGNNVIIQSGVIIRDNVTISDNCVIGSNTVVGGRSFSRVIHAGKAVCMEDCGSVFLGTGVETCSNCHIACGTLEHDVTYLDDYCQLDALVHVGHGSRIGSRTMITSGAHVAGNCVVGKDVWIGVNATVSNRLTVGDRAKISLGSVVTKDVPADMTVTGNFAIEHRRFMQNLKNSIREIS